jgi:hypothetical protein
MNVIDEDDLCESIDTIAEEVADNFHNYDHLFDLDPDDFEDEDDEETDEDDDTHLEP